MHITVELTGIEIFASGKAKPAPGLSAGAVNQRHPSSRGPIADPPPQWVGAAAEPPHPPTPIRTEAFFKRQPKATAPIATPRITFLPPREESFGGSCPGGHPQGLPATPSPLPPLPRRGHLLPPAPPPRPADDARHGGVPPLPPLPPTSPFPSPPLSPRYSALDFAEGADPQRIPQHVVADLHPPVVLLLLLGHLRPPAEDHNAQGRHGTARHSSGRHGTARLGSGVRSEERRAGPCRVHGGGEGRTPGLGAVCGDGDGEGGASTGSTRCRVTVAPVFGTCLGVTLRAFGVEPPRRDAALRVHPALGWGRCPWGAPAFWGVGSIWGRRRWQPPGSAIWPWGAPS